MKNEKQKFFHKIFRNYWGYEIEMLKNAAAFLNFSYTIENPPDGAWGHLKEDGEWSGLIGHASKNIVDFVICDVLIAFGRSQVFRNWYMIVLQIVLYTYETTYSNFI